MISNKLDKIIKNKCHLVYEKAAEFKHIIRLFNTNIDGRRKVIYGLRQVKGMHYFPQLLQNFARINPNCAGDVYKKRTNKQFKILLLI